MFDFTVLSFIFIYHLVINNNWIFGNILDAAHTAVDYPLARGNAEADKLAVRERTAHRLETLTRPPSMYPSQWQVL